MASLPSGMVSCASFTSTLEKGKSTMVQPMLNRLWITAMSAALAGVSRKEKCRKLFNV